MATEEEIEALALRDPTIAAALARERGTASSDEKQALLPFKRSHPEAPQPRGPWGTSWSPNFPIESQICREADNLHHGLALVKAERRAAAREKWAESAVAVAQEAAVAMQEKLKQRQLRKEALLRPLVHPSRRAGVSAPAVPAPPPPQRESARRPRYEPAKVAGPDGKFRLRGVQSTSDISKYAKNVDPYSRQGWELREAFKTMKSGQHAAIAAQTWGALHKWAASEKPIDQWYAETKAQGSRQRTSSSPGTLDAAAS
mmetsp:Transcript_26831/g.68838  ORF Transcript_26831/g.68838 Transcript_26831/m.68838 type:complete len:258 (-) Transcript_26831:32-805(-)|eukprot:CAMPEP_0183389946 /NCGR_PEP_ID=MMETSP0370-20130417/5282_1 /TAXON_ID=268820 /ORGANISM="Peridinium aciculiferum, Strain PAER-2" /LENGTH=257 /DNA_ID=CAMNT_0025569311 /DNA_START=59 /DNA_END=832 /DNA_ORIENTATION=+